MSKEQIEKCPKCRTISFTDCHSINCPMRDVSNLSQPTADLEELRSKFLSTWFLANDKRLIWNFFLPHLQKPVESEWISVKDKNLSHLKEGDCVLTLDVNGNIIPYKFFLEGLNMIGDHSDNNQRITHWMPLPSPPIQTK
jgi:hypothetical protein